MMVSLATFLLLMVYLLLSLRKSPFCGELTFSAQTGDGQIAVNNIPRSFDILDRKISSVIPAYNIFDCPPNVQKIKIANIGNKPITLVDTLVWSGHFCIVK